MRVHRYRFTWLLTEEITLIKRHWSCTPCQAYIILGGLNQRKCLSVHTKKEYLSYGREANCHRLLVQNSIRTNGFTKKQKLHHRVAQIRFPFYVSSYFSKVGFSYFLFLVFGTMETQMNKKHFWWSTGNKPSSREHIFLFKSKFFFFQEHQIFYIVFVTKKGKIRIFTYIMFPKW